MRSVKWLLVGLAISLPLGVGEGLAQEWCADEVKVRERLEGTIEDFFNALEDFDRCIKSATHEQGDIPLEKNHPAIPGLIAALNDPNSSVRERAVLALEHIDAETQDTVSALIATLKDPNASVRARAADALGNSGAETQETVPALIATLKDESSIVRRRAAFALGSIGVEAKDAVPALIDALKDEDSTVRGRAAFALGSIGDETQDVVPNLIAILKNKNPSIRWSAVVALGRMGANAKDAVPVLIAALKDEDLAVRWRVANALGHIVTDLYETAKNSEQLKTTQNIALTVQQALQDTDFEDTKQQINQILRDIAERLGTRIV